MTQGRKLKNRRARNIGIRMGIGQENHCEMFFPRHFQESSNSLVFIVIKTIYFEELQNNQKTKNYCVEWK
jgi:hypothetical protein